MVQNLFGKGVVQHEEVVHKGWRRQDERKRERHKERGIEKDRERAIKRREKEV